MYLLEVYTAICGIVVATSLALYILPLFILSFALGPQDLKAKYGDWALVTGSTSGIGLAIARKLASQGVNICIVALDDENFGPALETLRKTHPSIEFRPIAVNLAGDPAVYMDRISSGTQDIPISIVVNNAGYLLMGYFDERSIGPLMGNLECNAAAGIRISHMMYSRMIAEGRRGCLAFTSSSAWFIPAPYATMYGATKAMLSNFAVSLSIEARNHGVDVCVVHPSYTHTNLYENNPKIGVLNLLAKFGWTGEDVANVLFESVGRVVVRDAGAYSVLTNLLGRVIDSGSLARIIMPFRHGMAPPPKSVARKTQ